MSSPSPKIVNGLGAPPSKGTPLVQLPRDVYVRALDCVHCGLCLPACPTYTQNGLEADSPRGRIMLMKGLADGAVTPTAKVVEHLDLCLDCRACETACPSGVVYHELIETTRPRLAPHRRPTLRQRALRWMTRHVFAYPTRMKLALLPVRLLQWTGLRGLAAKLPLASMLPENGARAWEKSLAGTYPAEGERKATVGLLEGCVTSVLFQEVNRQAVDLLRRAGCDVVVPSAQRCCGAVHHHADDERTAVAMARANIEAFAGVDYVVSTAAGCGAMLKEYAHLLRHDAAWAGKAAALVGKARDVTALLAELGLPTPTHAVHATATYHDACHLAHGQRVTQEPRTLLAAVPGLRTVPLVEADMCCGAAGTYNLTQPEMARALGQRKVRHIAATGAGVVVTANTGCAMQIEREARAAGLAVKVEHPVTLLHRAVIGAAPPTG